MAETTEEHADAIRKRLPAQKKKLAKPREANRDCAGNILADDFGLVLEVFHADSPDLEQQWTDWLRTAAKDTLWLYKELKAAWRTEERWRERWQRERRLLPRDSKAK